jgi:hypothetical protein
MSATLALMVIWSIVALVFYCCYRLWRWSPRPATQPIEATPTTRSTVRRRAA